MKFSSAGCRMSSSLPYGASAAGPVRVPMKRRDHVGEPVDVRAVRTPRASMSESSASWLNCRILSAYSSTGPSPPITGVSTVPVIATTSRYTDGASGRLSRSSSSQSWRRAASVEKSRNCRSTAFLILKA